MRKKSIAALLTLCLCTALTGCSRHNLRQIINWLGKPDKEKPRVYHEYEGFAPGIKKSNVEEDFGRYHYYIAPDKEELIDSDPEIYFRQDYEVIEPEVGFDEEKYWQEHPLIFDDAPSEPASDTKAGDANDKG